MRGRRPTQGRGRPGRTIRNCHWAAPLSSQRPPPQPLSTGGTGKWHQNQYGDWGSCPPRLSRGSTARPTAPWHQWLFPRGIGTPPLPSAGRPLHHFVWPCCQNTVIFCHMEEERVGMESPAAMRPANCLKTLIALSSPTWSLCPTPPPSNHGSGSHIEAQRWPLAFFLSLEVGGCVSSPVSFCSSLGCWTWFVAVDGLGCSSHLCLWCLELWARAPSGRAPSAPGSPSLKEQLALDAPSCSRGHVSEATW